MKQLPSIAINEATVLQLIREHIAQEISGPTLRRLRRQALASIETVSPEEGGECLGLTARSFQTWCKRVGIAKLNLGYKSKRYSVRAIAEKMQQRALKPKPGSRVARYLEAKSAA